MVDEVTVTTGGPVFDIRDALWDTTNRELTPLTAKLSCWYVQFGCGHWFRGEDNDWPCKCPECRV